MNPLLNINSRTGATFTVEDGDTVPLFVGGDYFHVYAIDGTLDVSVNDGPFAPCPAGLIHQGVVGRNDVSTLQFRNTSGTDVEITVIFGKGQQYITGQVSIVNPTFSLSSADKLAITPAPCVLEQDEDVLTGTQLYTDLVSIKIFNTDASVNITWNGNVIAPGDSREFSVLRPQDVLDDITVNATGSSALVIWQKKV